MRIRKLWFLLPILFFAAAVHANPVTMQFVGVNGASGGGYYVSPYYGTMNGVPVTLFCVDIANHVSWGQVWQANLSTITNGSDLSNTRYGGSVGLAAYQQAAWLINQFATHPSEYVDLQFALWNLFNASLAPDTVGSNAWLTLAAANYGSVNNLGSFRVVTNLGPVTHTGQVQEFIILTPEPSALILFGSGLLGLSGFLRRRIGA
jgi:hypothetical protein